MGENVAKINSTESIRMLGGGGGAHGVFLWTCYQLRVSNNLISDVRSGDGSRNNYGILSAAGEVSGMYLINELLFFKFLLLLLFLNLKDISGR